MQRFEELKSWVKSLHPDSSFYLEFAAADADFRRYFRVMFSPDETRILMDAPPDKVDIHPYVKVRNVFSMLNVPTIYAYDVSRGFMELEDLGCVTYLTALQQQGGSSTAYGLFMEAVDTLLELQQASRSGLLPDYSHALLKYEMQLFPEWCVGKEWKKSLSVAQHQIWLDAMQRILAVVLAQARVFVHRDFIVRNLMVTPGRPGVLDFQDAVYGPITYDLVSLLRDAFVEFDEEFVIDIVVRYWEKARRVGLPVAATIDDFYRDFEWMGVQRHLKVAGVFCRLWHRDGKDKYLPEVARFLNYVKKTTRRYTELSGLYQLMVELSGENEIKTGYTF